MVTRCNCRPPLFDNRPGTSSGRKATDASTLRKFQRLASRKVREYSWDQTMRSSQPPTARAHSVFTRNWVGLNMEFLKASFSGRCMMVTAELAGINAVRSISASDL